jgi:hypothetical protein
MSQARKVYVRPFPESGGKLLVSTSGGTSPHWRRDGKEIFYVGASRELMAAKVTENGSTLAIDTARPLFQAHTASDFPPDFCLDVSADGQRFLIVSSSSQKLPFPIAVVINWDAGLKTQ